MAFLIGFFWLLFAIVGVQLFKSSFKRTCVWYENIEAIPGTFPPDGQNYTWNIAPENIQLCGGHINATTGEPYPWLNANLEKGTRHAKGYLCPVHSICLEGQNPYNGTVSFDNVFQSLQLVFVIMSSNTFSDLLYMMTASDYLAAALCKLICGSFHQYSLNAYSLRRGDSCIESLVDESGKLENAAECFDTDDTSLLLLSRLHFRSFVRKAKQALSPLMSSKWSQILLSISRY